VFHECDFYPVPCILHVRLKKKTRKKPFQGVWSNSVEMAIALLPSVFSGISSHFQVLLEHFDDPIQLQEAINCSEECEALLKNFTPTRFANHCPEHPQRQLTVLGRQFETDSTHQHTDIVTEEKLKLGKATNHVMIMLEETKEAVSVVKEMRQRVKSRKEHSIERARDVFNSLRKVIDEREKLIIADINRGAEKRENALKVSCQLCSCCYSYSTVSVARPILGSAS